MQSVPPPVGPGRTSVDWRATGTAGLSAAARLLLACTAPLAVAATPEPAAPHAPAAAPGRRLDDATEGVDWVEFEALATRHAAAPLVHHALAALTPACVPMALRTRLRRQAQLNALRNRGLVEDLARITAAFSTAGLPLVTYKGPVLAQQLYGDIGMRVCSDLDLLTDLASVDRAMSVMQALGYRFTPLRGQHALQTPAANLRHWHCCNFVGDSRRLHVDLHVRFAPRHFPVAADLSSYAGRLAHCNVGDHAFACFGDEDLLVLLATHAAKDLMWRRLTWFSELALLVHRMPAAALQRAYAAAERMGCRHTVLMALMLVQRLYGLPDSLPWPGTAAERARLEPLAQATVQRLLGPVVAEPHRLRVHFVIHPALRERRQDRWASYAAGLRALLDYARPPPLRATAQWPAALLRYPAYWTCAAGRRARRLAAGWPGVTGR